MARALITLFTVLLLGLFGWLAAYGQLPDHHLQLFDYSFGIKTGSYISLTRDSKGFVWILYPRNIQRFDGKRIKEFRLNEDCSHLYADSKGQVWISGIKGVWRYDSDFHGFLPVTVQRRSISTAIANVFETDDQKLYLLTNEGFHLFNAGEERFGPAMDVSKNLKPYSLDVFDHKHNTAFFRKADSLYAYHFLTGQLRSIATSNNYKIFALSESQLLASRWTNDTYLYDFAVRSVNAVQLPPALRTTSSTSLSIRSMIQYDQENFVIAAREGIFQYNLPNNQYRKLRFFQNGYPVMGNDYSSYLHLDKDMNVWMLSLPGITRFSLTRQALGMIRIPAPMNGPQGALNNIRQVTEDKEGNLWVATATGFAKWNDAGNSWKVYNANLGAVNQLSHPSVRGIASDGKNIILGPTGGGIWIFNPKTEQYKRPVYVHDTVRDKSERDFLDDITTLSNGNFLLMGRDALYLLEGGTYKLSIVDIPAGRENANRAIERQDGSIWLITGMGVHLLDASLRPVAKGVIPDKYLPLWAGNLRKDGSLLVTCNGGLYHATINNGKISVKPFTDAFEGLVLYSVYEDDKGIIWASCENGIYRYDPLNKELNLLDYADNVQGYRFNANGPYRNRDGIIFWSGSNGINYVQPETFDHHAGSLKVFIQNAKEANSDSMYCELTEVAQIPYSNRSIEVELLAPYFNNPDKVTYRYKIDGLDSDWKNLGNNNTLRLTSIPPGDYTLLVQASVNNTYWVDGENRFRFRIENPFWLNTWFIVCCSALLSGLVWLIVHQRNKKLELKQQELETEQAINYISGSIYRQQTIDEILWDVARNCIGRLHFEDCVIYLLDQERNVLVQKAAWGAKSVEPMKILNPIEIPVGKGITGTVAREGVAEIVNDTTRDPRYIQDGDFRFSEIAVPIKIDHTVLGVIDCVHSKKGFFTQRHLSVLTVIANLCANKITKAKAEKEKMEAERMLMDTKQKMAEAEMQALRAQMNPHFIFNCLNSINRYIVKSDQATASLYLTRFAKLIRLILDNSNNTIITLASELEALKLYIQMESIRFEKQFTYSLEVDERINPDTVHVPPLIIQPYVENAIWHGLLHKDTAGHLTIRIRNTAHGMLECIIEDNGVGRARAKELKSKSASHKKSLGMQLTESRLELLGRQKEQHAAVQIDDLCDENGSVKGTRVTLLIP